MKNLRAILTAALLLGSSVASMRGASTEIRANAPVEKLTLQTYSKDGFRTWLLRGDVGRYVNQSQIDITGLHLTTFQPDASSKIDSVIISPQASAFMEDAVVSGPDLVRYIRDDIEIAGYDWTYNHRQKSFLLKRNVRVVFKAKFEASLK